MRENVVENTENIFDTWELYRKIVESNNMFHKEIYDDVSSVLKTISADFSLLDLGCGDAHNLALVLRQFPIVSYSGVDLSTTALSLAKQNLETLPCSVNLQQGDLLQVLEEDLRSYDVIFSSFALHHLNLEQKARFFQAAQAHLKENGFLLLIDTFRDEQQDLDSYLQAYCTWLRNDWQGIASEEKEIACQHIVENDFPEMLSTFQTFAEQAGFSEYHRVSHYQWHNVLCFQR